MSDLDFFKDTFLPNIQQATVTYKRWRNNYPNEATAWDGFVTKILAGQMPTAPVMTSKFGKALVAAGQMAMAETSTEPPPPPSPTPTLRKWKPNPILGTVLYGGSTGSLDGLTPLDILSFIDISYHKLVGGAGGAMDQLLAANPNMKILVYKAQADMLSLGSSFPILWPGTDATSLKNRMKSSGISYEEALSHDAQSAPDDKWILRNSAGDPIPAYGYPNVYLGDVGLPSYQQRWVENALLTLGSTEVSKPGKIAGIWCDNAVGYPVAWRDKPGQTSVNEALVAEKYQYHDQYLAAVKSFWQYVGAELRDKRGFYIAANSADFVTSAGWNNGDDIDKYWAWHGQYVSAVNREHFTQVGSGAYQWHKRRDNPAWYDWYSQWTDNISAQEARKAPGFPGGVWVLDSVPSTAQNEGQPADYARYGYASFLLRWDGKIGVSYYLSWNSPSLWYIPEYRMDLGSPLGGLVQQQTSLYYRLYQGGIVIVNAHVSSGYTTTNPDGRKYYNPDDTPFTWGGTLAAGQALVLSTPW